MLSHEEATLSALVVAALSLLILLIKLIHCCVKLCARCCRRRHYSMADVGEPCCCDETGVPAAQGVYMQRPVMHARRPRPVSNMALVRQADDREDFEELSDDDQHGPMPQPVHKITGTG